MNQDKVYTGFREENEAFVNVDGKPLAQRHDLVNHSPTGFEWGYWGSGPAQLALALIADATGDDKLAVDLHMDYKFKFVGKLPKEGWTLTQQQVLEQVKALQTT